MPDPDFHLPKKEVKEFSNVPGIGKAYISHLVDKDYTGTTYGIYQTLIGIMTFFSSLIAGFLWKYIGPGAPFIFGAIMAAAAFIIFILSSSHKTENSKG